MNSNLIVLTNYNIGGQLLHGITYKQEKEVVVEPSLLITVNTVTDSTERRATNKPYKKIEISVEEKPTLENQYLTNTPEVILANLFDKNVANPFEKTDVLRTILEYAGLPSDASQARRKNK